MKYVALFAICIVLFSVSNYAQSIVNESNQVYFDMDATKEGLDYLNYSDDNLRSSKTTSAGEIAGVGSFKAVEVEDRAAEIPLLLRPLFVPVFLLRDLARPAFSTVALPISVITSSTDPAHHNEKFITNHPIGRPGDASEGNNREYLRRTVEKFDKSEQKTLAEMFKSNDSLTASVFKKPEYVAYETNFSDKQNANRPIGRTGRGRGNSRQLYPAHPDSP
ncbi:hypothetical protein [Cerasicoccus arenae]|uniref:Uncharacterized protein n=1 Tax=Cerasicoccus arenae TaxID=424488 RepID=A0A8J3GDK7_9BACT|nr:hypothetical protein [Cerasicoccus arenae]MBK1858267.1 hypothetical protein [Cerasicoccus arenae]GHC02282.1 hypothetical protein GCM10007047_18530 [Cerasicoccus arenae]